MDSKEAYSVKFLSEPVIYQNFVYFTEKWIEGNEYKTSIFKFENEVVERITFGGKESYPMIIDGNLHYLKSEEKINHFVRIKSNTEPQTFLLQFPLPLNSQWSKSMMFLLFHLGHIRFHHQI